MSGPVTQVVRSIELHDRPVYQQWGMRLVGFLDRGVTLRLSCGHAVELCTRRDCPWPGEFYDCPHCERNSDESYHHPLAEDHREA